MHERFAYLFIFNAEEKFALSSIFNTEEKFNLSLRNFHSEITSRNAIPEVYLSKSRILLMTKVGLMDVSLSRVSLEVIPLNTRAVSTPELIPN